MSSSSTNTESSLPAPFYTGPLAKTFRSLKLFSLSSLGLITALSPVLFVIEAPAFPMSARVAMAGTAILTSAGSTGLVGWCGAPYVSSMRRITSSTPSSHSTIPTSSNPEAVEMTTKNLLLKDLRTSVYDPTFLGPTSRPFATWELQSQLRVQVSSLDEAIRNTVAAGEEGVQTVAQTVDAEGKVQGEWIVRWKQDESEPEFAVGQAVSTGKVLR